MSNEGIKPDHEIVGGGGGGGGGAVDTVAGQIGDVVQAVVVASAPKLGLLELGYGTGLGTYSGTYGTDVEKRQAAV